MAQIQLYDHTGRKRWKGKHCEVVSGEAVCYRPSLLSHLPKRLRLVDIRLDETPGPGLAKDITAFIQAEK